MALMNLKMFATMLAMYVKKHLPSTNRGAMLVRCVNDGNMVAAVYGNDNYLTDASTRREVELVRRQLAQAYIEELGFGLTPDGSSWTLLVQADNNRYQTRAGKAFYMEMFRIFLEDTLQGASCNARGVPIDVPGRLPLEQGQPTG
jgi:hypothetical protein